MPITPAVSCPVRQLLDPNCEPLDAAGIDPWRNIAFDLPNPDESLQNHHWLGRFSTRHPLRGFSRAVPSGNLDSTSFQSPISILNAPLLAIGCFLQQTIDYCVPVLIRTTTGYPHTYTSLPLCGLKKSWASVGGLSTENIAGHHRLATQVCLLLPHGVCTRTNYPLSCPFSTSTTLLWMGRTDRLLSSLA